MTKSSLYFLIFCLLLALRDAFSQLLLHDQYAVHPVSMLFVYCWTALIFSYLFSRVRAGGSSSIETWHGLTYRQRVEFLLLSTATWVVYASTIWGIYLIGAPVFDVIDYAAMPLLTVGIGVILLKESFSVRRVVLSLIGCAGVVLIFLAAPAAEGRRMTVQWYLGLGLAFMSTIATSYCSAIQRRQVASGIPPAVVLLFRFPIPALLMTVWMLIRRPSVSIGAVSILGLLGLVGLFLPLLLLCFGFMRATLGQFSRFLFLIPLLIWVAVPLLIRGEVHRLSDWRVLGGSALLVVAYVASELAESWSPAKASKAAIRETG